MLLWTTFGLTLYPLLTAFTHDVQWIMFYAGLSGIFQAGLDLVFFDELMKTFPARYSATFVSLAQMLQYLSTVASPLVGTLLADQIGLGGALVVSAGLRLAGFGLFAWGKEISPNRQCAVQVAQAVQRQRGEAARLRLPREISFQVIRPVVIRRSRTSRRYAGGSCTACRRR